MPRSTAFSLACVTQHTSGSCFQPQVKIALNVTVHGAFPTYAVCVSASVLWGRPSEAGGDRFLRASSFQFVEDFLKRVDPHTFQKWSLQLALVGMPARGDSGALGT